MWAMPSWIIIFFPWSWAFWCLCAWLCTRVHSDEGACQYSTSFTPCPFEIIQSARRIQMKNKTQSSCARCRQPAHTARFIFFMQNRNSHTRKPKKTMDARERIEHCYNMMYASEEYGTAVYKSRDRKERKRMARKFLLLMLARMGRRRTRTHHHHHHTSL